MITHHTLRRAVAVPAALTLALGGALLGTTAATAAPGTLNITTPATDGLELESLSVTVSGTAIFDSTISVYQSADATGTPVVLEMDDQGLWLSPSPRPALPSRAAR